MIAPKRKIITEFQRQNDGDVRIYQRDAKTRKFTGRIMTNYGHRIDFLIHSILFHIQSGQKVPHRDDWNQHFFRGVFSIPDQEPDSIKDPLLRKLVKRSREGKLLTLAEKPEESSENFEVKDLISGEQIAPRINANGDLVYTTREGRPVLTFPKGKVIALYQGIINPLTQNIRGQRRQIGEVYSNIPFEAYEERFRDRVAPTTDSRKETIFE